MFINTPSGRIQCTDCGLIFEEGAQHFCNRNTNTNHILKDSGKREQFDTGAVRDTREGKGRYDLISPIALKRLALVYERGASKYKPRNWEAGIPICRCIDSAIRHLEQFKEGYRDEDHLAQAAWNCFSAIHLLEMIDRGLLPKELNDLISYLPGEKE